jgi:hypothetical protein
MAINLNIISKFDDAGLQKMQGKLSGLGSSFTKLAGVAVGALATIGLGKYVKDSIKAASDLDESINAVSVAYGDAADAVLAIGDNSALAMGVSQTAFNEAAVRFSAFAERVVGDGGDVAGFVKEASQRATDFASVFNIDVAEALRVFQSGLAGEAEPLKRFGINLLQSEVNAYAMANGIGEVGRELTETEKVQARYGLLLQSTEKTAGDFANTSSGMANSQRILQASFANLTAEIGSSLTPVVATLFQALEPIAFAVMPMIAEVIETKVAPALQKVVDAFMEFSIGISESGFSFNFFMGQLSESAGVGIDKVAAFFTGEGLTKLLTGFAEMRTTVINAFIKIIPLLVTAIMDILPAIIDSLASMIPELLDSAVETFTALVDAVALVLPNLIMALLKMLPDILDTIVGLLPSLIDAGMKLFTGLLDALILVVPNILEGIIDAIPQIVDAIVRALPQILAAAFTLFTAIVSAVIKATPDIIDAIIKLIPQIVTALLDNIPKLVDAGFQLIKGLAKGMLDAIPRLLGDVVGAIGRTLTNGVNAVFQIKSPSRVFYGIGENVVKGLQDGIMDGKRLLESASFEMGNTVEVSARNSLVGMDTMSLAPTRQESEGSGRSGATYNVTVNTGIGTDPVSVGREVVNAIKRFESVSGKVFVGV